MIKHVRTVVVLLACLFGLSPKAHAGFIDLLDQLSGPGPFWGVGGDIRLYCAGITSEATTPALPAALTSSNWSWLTRKRCLANDLPDAQRPWISLDLAFSYSRSIHNDLLYPANTPDTHVSIYSLEPAIWFTPTPPVAIGTGIGVDTFRGPTFSSFSRFYVTPVKVDIKPFAFSKSSWSSKGAGLITIRADYVLFPKGFDAQDFGSIGTFHTEHESLPRITILFDAGQWSWLR